MKRARRKLIVFSTLLMVLSLTSALLLAVAPAPLVPDAASSLFAVDSPANLDAIFETKAHVKPGRWKYIFIHHSNTASGNAVSIGQASGGFADHFLIGNGDGCEDGELQVGQRWNHQLSALPPAGATKINPACISICMIGNFDQTVPTQTQLRRLNQLVGALQSQLHIPDSNVQMIDQPGSTAEIGRYFPKSAFRQQLLHEDVESAGELK